MDELADRCDARFALISREPAGVALCTSAFLSPDDPTDYSAFTIHATSSVGRASSSVSSSFGRTMGPDSEILFKLDGSVIIRQDSEKV